MKAILFGYLFALGTAAIVIAGDFILKLAADGGHPIHHRLVVAGSLLYALSALAWFLAMRHVTLAQAGVAYSMLTLIALAVIGAVYFDEPIGAREIAGIGAALAAMGLMTHVA